MLQKYVSILNLESAMQTTRSLDSKHWSNSKSMDSVQV